MCNFIVIIFYEFSKPRGTDVSATSRKEAKAKVNQVGKKVVQLSIVIFVEVCDRKVFPFMDQQF